MRERGREKARKLALESEKIPPSPFPILPPPSSLSRIKIQKGSDNYERIIQDLSRFSPRGVEGIEERHFAFAAAVSVVAVIEFCCCSFLCLRARRRLRVQAGDINSAVAIMILARGGGGRRKRKKNRERGSNRGVRERGERERAKWLHYLYCVILVIIKARPVASVAYTRFCLTWEGGRDVTTSGSDTHMFYLSLLVNLLSDLSAVLQE